MSTSPDGQPTKVLPQTNEPPANAAPATRRTPGWPSSVPAHIGRFRTSSLVLGGLFLVLFVLNLFLPQPDSGTTPVVLPSGQTVEVPNSALPSDVPISTPSPTDPVTPTDDVLPEDEEPVTTPSRPTTRAPAPTPTPTRAPSPTTATTADETTEDETTESEPTATTVDETTADPTD